MPFFWKNVIDLLLSTSESGFGGLFACFALKAEYLGELGWEKCNWAFDLEMATFHVLGLLFESLSLQFQEQTQGNYFFLTYKIVVSKHF